MTDRQSNLYKFEGMILWIHVNYVVAPTISRIIQQFKGAVSKQIGFSMWQKLFYDHIIRNEQEYQKTWEYIDTNPLKWELDCYHIK